MFRLKARQVAAIAMALAVFVFGVVILNTPMVLRAQVQGEQSTWVPVPGVVMPYDNINAIFMTGVNSAWLAGDQTSTGVIYYIEWQSDHWARTYSSPGFKCPLRGISAVSNQNVWAVGDCGLILHGTASGWQEVSNPLPNTNLNFNLDTIQMLGDGSEGWAGGYILDYRNENTAGPLLLHYKNNRWSQDTSITGLGRVTSLHFAQGGGWAAVGPNIWQYEDGKWYQETLSSPCPYAGCFADFNSVRAISGQEAWAVGDFASTCGICVPQAYVLHKYGGIWQSWLPSSPSSWLNLDPRNAYYLNSVYFTDSIYGLMVGGYIPHDANPTDSHRPLVLSVINGAVVDERPPDVVGDLNAVAAYEPGHALAVGTNGLILSNGYGFEHAPGPIPTYVQPFYTPTATPTPLPSTRVDDPHHSDITYFPLVGHTLWGGFRDYWNAHGGLEQFGYPITEQFQEASPTDGKSYTVQYFERARFEWHPENKSPYDVLLGLLGRTITHGRENEAPFLPAQPQTGAGFSVLPGQRA